MNDNRIPLFKYFPALEQKLPYVSLGDFPTPIQKVDELGKAIYINDLYIKRDDLSGSIYGGNKVRKLEFLLAHALKKNIKEVMTFGCAGSNHALATAIYARQVGLRSISILSPQPNTRYTRKNLLMSYAVDAELHHYGSNFAVLLATYYQFLRHALKKGTFPMSIPRGGTTPLGVIGFVNAIFELKEQIVRAKMPEPDYLYVPLGSMGTAVGLLLGILATGLKTTLMPVRVVPERIANKSKFIKLFRKTNDFLKFLDTSFGYFQLSEQDIEIRNEFFGEAYALFTKKGIDAVSMAKEKTGLQLDGTYTGKTLAALIEDAQKRDLQDKVILFWLTLNSKEFSDYISAIDYRNLPKVFHRYFESDVQPLDTI